MALVRKKIKGKEYLYEVSYVKENGKLKQKWKLVGRSDKVTNNISNFRDVNRPSKPVTRVQIPAAA